MKITVLLFFLILIQQFHAQTILNEGKISYKISIVDELDSSLMSNTNFKASSTIYFAPKKSRIEMSLGEIMSIIVISDEEKGYSLTLMDGVMGKFAFKTTLEEIEKMQQKNTAPLKLKPTNEFKNILGYKCKKATYTDDLGNENEIWYTEAINFLKKGQQQIYASVPGVAMDFVSITNGVIFKFTATSIEKTSSFSPSLFDLSIPTGYEEKNINELFQIKK